jgi:Uncharacterized protein conserved in bacteria (DUF2252)
MATPSCAATPWVALTGDAIAICAYLGTGKSFDKAIRAFAESYADQSDKDFAEFTAGIAEGRLCAHEDAGGAEGARAARQLAANPAKAKRAPKRTPAATSPTTGTTPDVTPWPSAGAAPTLAL